MADERYIPDIVANAMLTAWNEICSDTGCHPTDIKRNHEGRRGHLGFTPEHWARMTGQIVKTQFRRLGLTPAALQAEELTILRAEIIALHRQLGEAARG